MLITIVRVLEALGKPGKHYSLNLPLSESLLFAT